MIYLEETYDIAPAMPETLDSFIEFARESLNPAYEKRGGRLVAAWTSSVELIYQPVQILEFDDLGAFETFRKKARQDPKWRAIQTRLEELAPKRRTRLLEPAAPLFVNTLHNAIEESRQTPLKAYNLAILEVIPNVMEPFLEILEASAADLPIAASWRPIAGNPYEIIDVWKGSLQHPGYMTKEQYAELGLTEEWWRGLREAAPQERVVTVHTLPHSPLQ
jgi:NIPSNAP protein